MVAAVPVEAEALAGAALEAADPVADLAEVPEALAADPVDLEVLTDLADQDPQEDRISVLALAHDGGAAGTEDLITVVEAVALADCLVSFWCRWSSLSYCFLLSAIAFPCCLAETERE